MANIAIIDDNTGQAGTLQKHLKHHIQLQGSSLGVMVQYPFKDVQNFFPFIDDNNICLLILDERLNDQSNPDGFPVDYKGNQLVLTLRERLKDFPIFMVTTHYTEADLLARRNEFEDLINRTDLTVNQDTAPGLVSKMLRSAQRFLDNNISELTEFNDLTIKVAGGAAEPNDIDRLKALQSKLELPYSGFDDRKSWLDAYEKEIAELESLRQEILKKLGSK